MATEPQSSSYIGTFVLMVITIFGVYVYLYRSNEFKDFTTAAFELALGTCKQSCMRGDTAGHSLPSDRVCEGVANGSEDVMMAEYCVCASCPCEFVTRGFHRSVFKDIAEYVNKVTRRRTDDDANHQLQNLNLNAKFVSDSYWFAENFTFEGEGKSKQVSKKKPAIAIRDDTDEATKTDSDKAVNNLLSDNITTN